MNISDNSFLPKEGDDPFERGGAHPHSPTWAYLEWLRNHWGDQIYAEAFKEAADKIVAELERGEDWRHPDQFFMPIAYLYRHSFELQLKRLLNLGLELEFYDGSESRYTRDNIEDYLDDYSHNLHCSWDRVRDMLEHYFSEDPEEPLNGAEKIIQRFNDIDRTGQNLRYSQNTSEERTIDNMPESVDLVHMRRICQRLWNLLNGCITELENRIQTRLQRQRDYRP